METKATKEELLKMLIIDLTASTGAQIIVKDIPKNNTVYTGLVFKYPDTNVAPTLYLESLYEDYLNADDYDIWLSKVEVIVSDALFQGRQMEYLTNTFPFDSSEVRAMLINTEANKSRLSKCPHRDFLDMSILYYFPIKISPEETAIVIIDNEILSKNLKVSEAELYKNALLNLKKDANVQNLTEILEQAGCIPEEILEDTPSVPMEVISNKRRSNGAAVILVTSVLDKIAEAYNVEEIILLPSSTHEMIAIPKDHFENVASNIVYEVNQTLRTEDVLTNSIYLYSSNTKKITFYEKGEDI